jgi:hypothetical protein
MRKIAGVSTAKVSQSRGTAEIAYDVATLSPETIAEPLMKSTGFKTEVSQTTK